MALTSLSGCGTARIDTGANGNPQTPIEAPPVISDPEGCWQSAKRLPDSIQTFCTEMPAHLKSDYQTAVDLICKRGKLINLLNPGCGWNGEGDPLHHLRVLHSTDVDDRKTKDFSYLSVYGLRLEKSKFGYARLVGLAVAKPELFDQWFEVPAPATITPLGTTRSADNATLTHKYNLEVNGLAKFGFDGEVVRWRVTDRLTAIFNRAVGNLQGVKVRRNLTLIDRDESKQSEQQFSIEERLIPDMGQHQIALSQMIKLDLVEFRNRHTNALATDGPAELLESED